MWTVIGDCMEFKDKHTYKVKLLKAVTGHYNVPYGNVGDIVSLSHSKRYSTYGKLCVVEGHGYGTNFTPGIDIDVIEDLTESKGK